MILVYTGDGKGKTSAALGNVFRALGHGWRVLVIQFMKGDWPIVFGELKSAKRHPKLTIVQMGQGFVKIMGDKKPLSKHKSAAASALEFAKKKILSGKYDLVVLDEVLYALETANVQLVSAPKLLQIMKIKPKKTHLILTGRINDLKIRKQITRVADLVTEMKEIKHPYQKGISAQKGIDY